MVCHICDNRRCVNPSHLFLGTCSDNMKDCYQKGRMSLPKTNKLSEFQVAQIKAELRKGKAQASIALEYGVGRKTVGDIATGKTWKDVT